jgi:transcription elongation factor Elf1
MNRHIWHHIKNMHPNLKLWFMCICCNHLTTAYTPDEIEKQLHTCEGCHEDLLFLQDIEDDYRNLAGYESTEEDE